MTRRPLSRDGKEASTKAVTLADVGRLSGVSPATVTRALHGSPLVRPETRERVEKTAHELGYVPHLGARALATQTSETVGLLGPDSRDSFFGQVATGLEERALQNGFATLLATSHRDAERERRMIELFVGKRVDGIVIVSAAGKPTTWFPNGNARIPVVLVDWDARLTPGLMEVARSQPVPRALQRIARQVGEPPFTHVRTDDFEGAIRGAEHLIALGHRHIAFAGLQPMRPALLRLLGVRRALESAGLPPPVVVECPPSLEMGQVAGRQLLDASPRPTAVVAFDDTTAIGIVRAVHAAGMRVPQDLSIIGFDDVEVAAFIEPPLTTVGQPAQALGGLAVEVIFDELKGLQGDVPTLLPGELFIRASTGACPEDID